MSNAFCRGIVITVLWTNSERLTCCRVRSVARSMLLFSDGRRLTAWSGSHEDGCGPTSRAPGAIAAKDFAIDLAETVTDGTLTFPLRSVLTLF
ncbi:MAG: hypothetical protein ACXW3X_14875 [Rhodoplanes sp.]